MDIRINGIVEESIVDGPGLRLAVFTQGCPHGCPGCHNPDTHAMLGGRVQRTRDILAMLEMNPLLDGLTLSGGEPFVQPAACLVLARKAKAMGKNVWIYSGYTYEALANSPDPQVTDLLAACDVLVDGPFVQHLRSLELDFRGSSNQRLVDLNKTRASGQLQLWQRKA